MKLVYLLLALLAFTFQLKSQTACVNTPYSFSVGEQLRYEISYNWGFIWVNAGEVHFQVRAHSIEGVQAFHFFSTGRSYPKLDWLFKVRDTFEVYSRAADLHPLFYRRHTLEGGFRIQNQYRFDPAKKLAYAAMEESRTAFHRDTIQVSDCTFDVLTATYVARSINFDKHQSGDTIGLQILLDGKTFELPVVLRGYEKIKNRDGKWWDCILFSAVLDRGTMFRAGEELLVWVSDDEQKIPVMMEAKIAVGSIKIYLKSAVTSGK
ncbi:MAG: DUF3108 domain-containing protein [Bacteroidetes bacterium]|nr:DUF3108 domain-containing protein [Bacteroidota bacterium]MBU1579150.1 DUF3108 domain-containing protein [Bacteroidota bacterium]MBU2464932.1 DUF3108 domain-containing protein [Bacteroidota bacterium]MBU2557911.1 DUF3108 domain-containing protein [Bacteroidota bacterium]